MTNTSILAAFERMWQHVIAKIDTKADVAHNHDDLYYTESEMDTKISDINNSVDSKISTHSTSTSAHNDIRDLITGLTTRLNTLADSDDTTLDQLSEIVAYIKSNKSLIESVTTTKVNVADIIDNLTTNVSDKPLSAAQGVVLNNLISVLQGVVDGKVSMDTFTSHTGDTSNPHGVTKAQVGLGNVDDTSDMNKPVSNAQAQAIADAKAAGVNAQANLEAHNVSANAHTDIRDAVTRAQNKADSAYNLADTKADEGHIHSAEVVTYDNTTSGLSAANVQDAIDEIDGVVDILDESVLLRNIQSDDIVDILMPINTNWFHVIYGGGKFISVPDSNSNIVAYSIDGHTWEQSELPSPKYWRSIAYGNETYVISTGYGGGGTIAYSTDGINWNLSNLPFSDNKTSVAYGNGKFVAIGYLRSNAAYSTDGITWTKTTLPSDGCWSPIIFGGDKFVAIVEDSNVGAYSTDGITWSPIELPTSATYWEGIAYGGGKFIVLHNNYSNKMIYSSDGITWTQSTLPSSYWTSITYGNGKFVAIGYNSNKVAYSEDGITWNQSTLPSARFYSIAYGDGKFVAVSVDGKATTSEDGIIWSSTYHPSIPTLVNTAGTDITSNIKSLVAPDTSSLQSKITGNAGDFVVIGSDGNVTTKTVPSAEEASF